MITSLFSQRIESSINLPTGSKPNQVYVDEQSNNVYVTDFLNARIFEIDGATKKVHRIFNVPTRPSVCIVNPTTKKLYTYCDNEGSSKYLTVIDLNTGAVDSFYTHSGYYGIYTNFALHPSMDKVYFLDGWDLYVYNGSANILSKVKATQFRGPLYVSQIGIDTMMRRVYVPTGGRTIMVVDCTTDSVITTLTIDQSTTATTNIAAVNQSKSLLFVSEWLNHYDKIFSTRDNQFLAPQINEISTDNWQTSIHEQLNVACRSHEIDVRCDIIDLEQHTTKLLSFNQGSDGRLVAINQKSARAFYIYRDSTISFDLIDGTQKVFAIGKGNETVSYSLQLGSFNQTTEELYIPNRVTGTISVLKDTAYSGNPIISSIYIIDGAHSLVIKGSRFGFLQGSSIVTVNGLNLGAATYWSPDSVYFENNPRIATGIIILNVLGRTATKTLSPAERVPNIAEVARLFSLDQNYPNPFNPTTTISFTLPSQSFVTLKVRDIMGREVATIVSEEMSAGSYSKQWNAKNIVSGIYFYRLQSEYNAVTKKLIIIK